MKTTLITLFIFATHFILFAENASIDTYQDKIKPLFKERCYACHGALKQKGKLRMDTVKSMKSVIDDGELLYRLESDDEDEVMPPEGHSLDKEDIALIKNWIEAGAPAPAHEIAESDPKNHWSFQKLPDIDQTQLTTANPIDHFLNAKQIEQKLIPSDKANKAMLIRRLYFDLIGLPPNEAQLKDKRPLKQIIDDLLERPQYGERWGRHWMDIWRYSDWYGLGAELRDSQKHLWHWRDWIVKSLNSDKGYDQMITEMLAGDEIAPTDKDALAATGFLARSYYKFNRTTWLDNTIEHTAKAFIGLTMNCAKCHDHKYDPIDHEDYYRFRAIFEPYHVRTDALPGSLNYNASGLPRVYDEHLDTPTYVHRRGEESKPIKSKKMSPAAPAFLSSFAKPAKAIKLPLEAWAPGSKAYVHEKLRQSSQAKIQRIERKLNALKNNSVVQAPSKLSEFIQLKDDFQNSRPELWTLFGSGWRYQGGILSNTIPTMERNYLRSKKAHPEDFELNLKFQTTGGKTWKSTGVIFDANADGSQAHGVYISPNGQKIQLFHILNGKHIYPNARANTPIKLNEEYALKIQVRDHLANVYLNEKLLISYELPHRLQGSVELFSFDSTADFYGIAVSKLDPKIVLQKSTNKKENILPKDLREVTQKELLLAKQEQSLLEATIAADKDKFSQQQSTKAQLAGRLQLEVRLANAQFELAKANPAKKANILKTIQQCQNDLKAKKYPKYASIRGSLKAHINTTDKVDQYSPLYPKTTSGRRTALANWLTHRDNPLTARVAINHIWLRHFGSAIVDTVFDFGRQAPKPLQQDLLDHLAVEFINSGWSMKHMHRLILNSQSWQRSSANLDADAHTIKTDPQNHYFWRMNPRRMESQLVRDGLLSLANNLDLKMGGASLKPDPKSNRRSLYFFHSRDGRSQFLSTFDDADVFSCYRRSESIVPQQALALMNSQTVIQSADKISQSFDSKLTDADFCRQAYFRIIGRQINSDELKLCINYLKENKQRKRLIHSLLNLNDFLVIR